jgi:hypothetical protein
MVSFGINRYEQGNEKREKKLERKTKRGNVEN